MIGWITLAGDQSAAATKPDSANGVISQSSAEAANTNMAPGGKKKGKKPSVRHMTNKTIERTQTVIRLAHEHKLILFPGMSFTHAPFHNTMYVLVYSIPGMSFRIHGMAYCYNILIIETLL